MVSPFPALPLLWIGSAGPAGVGIGWVEIAPFLLAAAAAATASDGIESLMADAEAIRAKSVRNFIV